MPDVVIVGAGPVGMLLAAELTRSGVDALVLERRREAGAGSRAIGIHAPVLKALESSGITDELLERAQRVLQGEARSLGTALGRVHFDRLHSDFGFVATLPQAATEQVLAARAPAPLRGAEVVDLKPDESGVRVRARIDGRITESHPPIVVVASGSSGRDLVFRRRANATRTYRDRYLMTDALADPLADQQTAVVHLDPSGVLESFPLPNGLRRYVAWDDEHASENQTKAGRLRAIVHLREGAESAAAVESATSFGVRRFVASQLRHGRLFVIGDTAHEVSPIGGQGMNLGLLDAATLAPLLTQWVRSGATPEEQLGLWERQRVRSARRAAALASLNTRLGRPLRPGADRVRRAAVATMLSGTGTLFAHAYSMGLDSHA
ncbi:NAD(P)/FAD-dependent oxidoreductase [Microbacterium marmarense]|uniref:NAD(P)/FAD-dependent oxidoreductase n=1 Tax=Microbacterium marmarense TaxID=3122051 RepID=A0ABU8LPJ6_9MICO